jgi:hypothetical protein
MSLLQDLLAEPLSVADFVVRLCAWLDAGAAGDGSASQALRGALLALLGVWQLLLLLAVVLESAEASSKLVELAHGRTGVCVYAA